MSQTARLCDGCHRYNPAHIHALTAALLQKRTTDTDSLHITKVWGDMRIKKVKSSLILSYLISNVECAENFEMTTTTTATPYCETPEDIFASRVVEINARHSSLLSTMKECFIKFLSNKFDGCNHFTCIYLIIRIAPNKKCR